MQADANAVQRSLASAGEALVLIRKYGHPAHPHIYETWYTYVDGINRALNEVIDGILRARGTIDAGEIGAIHEAHLSTTRLSDELDKVGGTVSDEIDQVLGMIGIARSSADAYGRSLADFGQTLDGGADPRLSRSVVENLVSEMISANAQLEVRLTESRRQMVRLKGNLEAVRAESLRDPLTALANRKSFDTTMAKFLNDRVPFSLVMGDVDRFKQFNDTYGHLTGDQVLRLVAATIRQTVGNKDFVARYGGEEFAIVLPGTELDAAQAAAENVRRAVMTRDLMKRSTGERLGRVTMSLGMSTWRLGDTAETMIERADRALYAAKAGGRNRVVTESEIPGDASAHENAASGNADQRSAEAS